MGVCNAFLMPSSKTQFFAVSKLAVLFFFFWSFSSFVPADFYLFPFILCHIIAEFGDLCYSYIFLNQYVVFSSEQYQKIDFSFGKKEKCDLLLELDNLRLFGHKG